MNSHLQQLADHIAHETEGIAADELAWRPEGKWSIAEILEHLSLTYSGTKIVFDRCLQAGKPAASAATIKDRVRAFVVIRLGYMPDGREAPAGTRPKGIRAESVVTEIAKNIAAMNQSISQCERQFGSRVQLANYPILGPLSAAEWRKFHFVHGQHHLRQVRRLRKLVQSNRKRRAET